MIIPNLKGGLGNQLFQIACAYAHARNVGTDFAINYDLPFGAGQGNPPKKYRDNLYKNIPHTQYVPKNTYTETAFSYQQLPTERDLLIDGYFQSELYFTKYDDEIRELFHFTNEDMAKWEKIITMFDPNTVIGCHVRRGDYIHYECIHPCLGGTYYNEAIQYITRGDIESQRQENIIICCDDWYELNQENIFKKYENITYLSTENSNELQDLYILSQCQRLIISNSTFSWWGAFLGYKNKQVIAPKTWFGKNGPQDTQDIYNPLWKKL